MFRRDSKDKIRKIIDLASEMVPPKQSGEFWREFDRQLKEKIEQNLSGGLEIKLSPRVRPPFSLRPLFAMATAAVLVITLGMFIINTITPTAPQLAVIDEGDIIAEIEILESVTGELFVFDDEQLLDELYILEELS